MNPMTHLIAATVAFLATHYVSSTPLRAKLVNALGNAYLGLYSLIAFATLGYMIWAGRVVVLPGAALRAARRNADRVRPDGVRPAGAQSDPGRAGTAARDG
ncbi:MAG: hypothetical protein HYU73_18690 [Betaproteobacteria bacterium]|nr:hypothetical protein [Betaproteobacteria bacterium]